MKTRNGFVSNSSSSSFIIAVPMGINTLGQLQDYIFGDKEMYGNPYAYGDGTTSWPVSTITSIVFRDIRQQEPKSMEELVEANCHGYTPEYERAELAARREAGVSERQVYDLDIDARMKLYERTEVFRAQYSQDKIKKFMAKNPECFFYVVEYSDNDGELLSAMEHGGLFDNIPHIRISHH